MTKMRGTLSIYRHVLAQPLPSDLLCNSTCAVRFEVCAPEKGMAFPVISNLSFSFPWITQLKAYLAYRKSSSHFVSPTHPQSKFNMWLSLSCGRKRIPFFQTYLIFYYKVCGYCHRRRHDHDHHRFQVTHESKNYFFWIRNAIAFFRLEVPRK